LRGPLLPLSPPPTDAEGQVVPHDHKEILDPDRLIRRVSSRHHVVEDKGVRRLSSLVFKPSSGPSGGLSIDLETQILEADIEPRKYVTSPPWVGSVAFAAGVVRQAGMKVGYHPLEQNPFHGEIWGPFVKPAHLANLAEWYVEIDGVAITAA
jgi:hypothetical protein